MSVLNIEIYSIIILIILILDYIAKFRKKLTIASIIWLSLAVSAIVISISNIGFSLSDIYNVRLISLMVYLLSTLMCSLLVYIYVKHVYINEKINIRKEAFYILLSILICGLITFIYVFASKDYTLHSLDRKFFNKLLTLAIIPNITICVSYVLHNIKVGKSINAKIVATLLITIITLILDISNESLFFVSSTFTLTTLIIYINKHQSLLNTDPLTGLSNKRALEVFIENLKPNQNVAVYNMDINKFKNINDTYGHLKGDYVLKKVAEVLRNSTRDSDLVIRNGGDEFLIIAIIRKEEDADKLLDRVRANLFEYSKDEEIKVTVSIGWGIYKSMDKTTMEDFNSFLKDIDKNMYTEKAKAHQAIEKERRNK